MKEENNKLKEEITSISEYKKKYDEKLKARDTELK